MSDTHPRLLSTREAADVLGIEPQTLSIWRQRGRGPQYIRLGNSPTARAGYRLSDLQGWLEGRTYNSVAEETASGQVEEAA